MVKPLFVGGGIALVSVLSFVVGYAFYFDSKRRSDPSFRKMLRMEKARMAQAQVKGTKKDTKNEAEKILAVSMEALDVSLDAIYAKSPQEREKIFYALLMKGEELLKHGSKYTKESVQLFYRAMKLIPNPTELLIALQKVLPEFVFTSLTALITEEGMKRMTDYFKSLPPKNAPVEIHPSTVVLMSGEVEQTWSLFATRDIEPGEIIYTENPGISSVMMHQDSNALCGHCVRPLNVHADDEDELPNDAYPSCKECGETYCSQDCLKMASSSYHPFLCFKTLDSDEKATPDHPFAELIQLCKSMNNQYGILTAKYLALLFSEELKGNATISATAAIKENETPSPFVHYEFLRPLHLPSLPSDRQEAALIRKVFARSQSSIGEFMTDTRYVAIKGTLLFNSIGFVSKKSTVSHVPMVLLPERMNHEVSFANKGGSFMAVQSGQVKETETHTLYERQTEEMPISEMALAPAVSFTKEEGHTDKKGEIVHKYVKEREKMDIKDQSINISNKVNQPVEMASSTANTVAFVKHSESESESATSAISTPMIQSFTSEAASDMETEMIKGLPMMEKLPVEPSSHSATTTLGISSPPSRVHNEVVRSVYLHSELTGYGLYHLSSHLQHSCDPNISIISPSGSHEIAIVANRRIAKQDKLSMSYVPMKKGMSAAERRGLLKEVYHIICMCSVCEAELKVR